jgi:hypothetical protein
LYSGKLDEALQRRRLQRSKPHGRAVSTCRLRAAAELLADVSFEETEVVRRRMAHGEPTNQREARLQVAVGHGAAASLEDVSHGKSKSAVPASMEM